MTEGKILFMEERLFPTTGKRIKRLRQDYEWSQKDLAAKLSAVGIDVVVSSISKIENSQRNPTPEMLAALARVLGTSTDYLLLLSDDPLAREDDEQLITHESVADYEENGPLVRLLLDTISKLSRQDQAMLLNVAERLAAANQPRIIGEEDG